MARLSNFVLGDLPARSLGLRGVLVSIPESMRLFRVESMSDMHATFSAFALHCKEKDG